MRLKIIKLMRHKFIEFLYGLIELFSDNFITYHSRPKLSCNVADEPFQVNSPDSHKCAIVLQGPLISKNNFTLETVNLYKKHFPQSCIILSTWSDENVTTIKNLEKLNIVLIKNEKPSFAGQSNVNFQIESSSVAVKHAKKLGFKYVLKTRTDQRVYSTQVLNFCLNTLKKFPLIEKKYQIERIIAFNLNTFIYRPYSISDMINFGHVDDMEKYWSPKFDLRKIEAPKASNFLDWSTQRYAEVHFATSFLENCGEEIDWSLKGYWRAIADRFCILNAHEIDLYWRKYTRKEYRHLVYTSHKYQQINFSDWLSFQTSFPDNIPEELILTSKNF